MLLSDFSSPKKVFLYHRLQLFLLSSITFDAVFVPLKMEVLHKLVVIMGYKNTEIVMDTLAQIRIVP